MAKKRLDVLLTELELFSSREKARAAIMAGEVFINGQKVDKAGVAIDETAEITVTSSKPKYVSRGGLKLEKAIQAFDIDFSNKIVLDIGASTGGFTDCSLQHGASKVYAVDVGYGQLAWELRQHEQVIVLERVNARYLNCEQIPEKVDIVTIDASFISLNKVLPNAMQFLKCDGSIVALIKPQFEAGREHVGKKGVVRDSRIHKQVINNVITALESEGMFAKRLDVSPIKGPEGNIEFVCLLTLQPPVEINDIIIDNVVDTAHADK